MTSQTQSQREILKEKVVGMVKDFIKTEGGITPYDLQKLFGSPATTPWAEVADALGEQEITLA
jgi:hypothetical protein